MGATPPFGAGTREDVVLQVILETDSPLDRRDRQIPGGSQGRRLNGHGVK
ncbi:MAG: hypothetical protein JW795_07470 [Chitinivibrionales bacterium]|nr:hypothetical protein [Chitinivibrionales bacterium]